jgi:hypothetical protein
LVAIQQLKVKTDEEVKELQEYITSMNKFKESTDSSPITLILQYENKKKK